MKSLRAIAEDLRSACYERDMGEFCRDIEAVCAAFDSMDRIGAAVDVPEGSRCVTITDTLLRQIVGERVP
jgi:hypothetical protein